MNGEIDKLLLRLHPFPLLQIDFALVRSNIYLGVLEPTLELKIYRSQSAFFADERVAQDTIACSLSWYLGTGAEFDAQLRCSVSPKGGKGGTPPPFTKPIITMGIAQIN